MRLSAKDSRTLVIINILAFVLVLVVNSLAGSTTLIGGVNTAKVSDANPTLITPPGYVFAIWGVIYLLLGAFVVYQALPNQQENDFQTKVGWLFALSCVVNVFWLLLWQYNLIAFSTVLMFALIATLTMIYTRLDIGVSKVSRVEKLAVHLPFSVYLGWITVATIANIAVTLVNLGYTELVLGAANWAVVVIIAALLITGLMLWTRRDVAYAAVLVWALTGIYLKQAATPMLSYTALAAAALITAGAVWALAAKKR
jgi:benzodiazapine receptor